jgi:hypothetical protein
MPVIRTDTTAEIATTTTTTPPGMRQSLLARLKDEINNPSAEGEPLVFEIPLGTQCYDVLVVWQEWADLPSEDRTRLILDAYADRQNEIAQALGVTYVEAIEQQLLPYAVISALEQNPKFAFLVCGGDKNKIEELMAKVRRAKREHGGIALPNGKVDLRFPTRAMADGAYFKLFSDPNYREYYWSVTTEPAVSA